MKYNLEAEWTTDCNGKMDYDGNILSISTRYWPDFTAKSSLVLSFKDWPEYIDLVSKKFEGDSQADVHRQVEVWAQEQMDNVVILLRTAFPNIEAAENA